ncbi:MAG TPA: sulfite exporter TauE/SafE family protein [Noviherbaspirillum sp.]
MLIEISLGIAVGLVMALTGAGGGILAVPLLAFGAGLDVGEAAPIGLIAVGIAAALGAALGLRVGQVRYRAALLMAVLGMLMAPVGVALSRRFDQRWLGVLFAIVLLYVAYRAFVEATKTHADEEEKRDAVCMRNEATGRFVWTGSCTRSLAMSGSIAGLLSGLLGVGGGFVMVPALKRTTDLPMQAIVPTSLAVIALVSVAGVVSSALSKGIDWGVAIPFASGALGGMLVGRMIAAYLPAAGMQKGFGTVSALVAVGMVAKSLA